MMAVLRYLLLIGFALNFIYLIMSGPKAPTVSKASEWRLFRLIRLWLTPKRTSAIPSEACRPARMNI